MDERMMDMLLFELFLVCVLCSLFVILHIVSPGHLVRHIPRFFSLRGHSVELERM